MFGPRAAFIPSGTIPSLTSGMAMTTRSGAPTRATRCTALHIDWAPPLPDDTPCDVSFFCAFAALTVLLSCCRLRTTNGTYLYPGVRDSPKFHRGPPEAAAAALAVVTQRYERCARTTCSMDTMLPVFTNDGALGSAVRRELCLLVQPESHVDDDAAKKDAKSDARRATWRQRRDSAPAPAAVCSHVICRFMPSHAASSRRLRSRQERYMPWAATWRPIPLA